jgi:hypothetical protein
MTKPIHITQFTFFFILVKLLTITILIFNYFVDGCSAIRLYLFWPLYCRFLDSLLLNYPFGILNHCYSKFRAKLIFETNNYITLHSKILIKLNTINYSTLHFTQIKVVLKFNMKIIETDKFDTYIFFYISEIIDHHYLNTFVSL